MRGRLKIVTLTDKMKSLPTAITRVALCSLANSTICGANKIKALVYWGGGGGGFISNPYPINY